MNRVGREKISSDPTVLDGYTATRSFFDKPVSDAFQKGGFVQVNATSWRENSFNGNVFEPYNLTETLRDDWSVYLHESIRDCDTTYIPMETGYIYLTVIMEWFSRKVLSWRLSNSLDSSFCVDALEEAIHRYGKPEIFNTDQGSQYSDDAFSGVLKKNDIHISMDGKGAWRDNVFVERLWRSIKYEEIYLNAYDSMVDAKQPLKKYFQFYNQNRKHQTLKATPDQVYYESIRLPEVV